MKYLNQQRNMRAAADKLVRYSSVSNVQLTYSQWIGLAFQLIQYTIS
ncbi:hypothetical protein D917_08788 [Trichinella nativa]|uniref:Uncharacterized protein n=1 Tax=Trichinella nativa TaxID=6335 RepID=A0A1Y3EP38_9BILA|nr:hypothetical protein Tsp_15870 [Trichinella spiralis]XP_003379548.1 hypothetical protein Tsp_03206 [Trichinella spiralis]OUC44848.1 hypothetical protein D917_08788 [Trichinella nativa]